MTLCRGIPNTCTDTHAQTTRTDTDTDTHAHTHTHARYKIHGAITILLTSSIVFMIVYQLCDGHEAMLLRDIIFFLLINFNMIVTYLSFMTVE